MPEPATVADLDPAARHRAVARRFTEIAEAVTDWDAPTPVAGWIARDVVHHLVRWFSDFLAAGGIHLTPGPTANSDPVSAWAAHTTAVQALLDGHATAAGQFTHPQAGSHRLADAIDRFYTADVFMHTWDLATAIGLDPALDPAWCEQMLTGMEPIEEMLRASGQYGPRIPIAEDADPQSRLAAFIGRDPNWKPDAQPH